MRRGQDLAVPILLLHKRWRQLAGRRGPVQSSAKLSRLAEVALLGKSALLVLGSIGKAPLPEANARQRVPAFRPISPYYRQAPPIRGREISSREAVLPLMYRVREDGLQTGPCRRPNVC